MSIIHETSAIIIGVFFAFLFTYSVVVVRIHNFMTASFNLDEEEDDPMQNPPYAMPPDGLEETERQKRPPPSYVSKGVTKVNNNQFAAMMWVEKNAFMAEYKASSAQYNTKSRTITETILTADKLSKAGKQEDAQKLYESAAQSMLDLKNEPEYA